MIEKIRERRNTLKSYKIKGDNVMWNIKAATEALLNGCVIKSDNNVNMYTPDGKGKVIENNLITGMLKVSLDRRPDAAPLVVHRHSVKLLKDAYIRVEKEELEALKGIE